MKALIDKITVVRDEAALAQLLADLSPGAVKGPVRIGFVNAHGYNLCYENPAFLSDLLGCDYVFRDGAGMKILYKLLGRDPGLNMNGTDFIPKLIDVYRGRDVALMGTDFEVLERASAKIAGMGVQPVTKMDGFQEEQAYVQAMADRPVPLVILAMGMPKQERVAGTMARNAKSPCVIVCGGAILDFIGEKVKRAPEIFRKFGMEWVYRLTQEPRRLFKRYVIGNAVFLYRAVCLRPTDFHEGPKKKILHVVRQYAPAIGGLESYVQSMAAHQGAAGYECHVLTLNKVFHGDAGELPAHEVIEGIPVRRVKFFGKRRFFIPMVSPFYFRQFDIVHVHNTDVFFDYVAVVGAVTRVPIFATTHGGFFHTKDFSIVKKLYFNTITRFSACFYKAIFAISQNDFDTFKSLNTNIVMQPNAIEPLGDSIASGDDFVYIGRLAQHKNIDRAIRIFGILKAKHNIAGNLHVIGPEWDVHIADLEAVTREAGVSGQVTFHGSARREDMRKIAQACGYFISASAFEGFGMSMLEGMSVGLIPFVHENESFKELVQKSGVGVCTNFENMDAAAALIAAAIAQVTPEQRKAAYDFAREFSWAALVRNTSDIYEVFSA